MMKIGIWSNPDKDKNLKTTKLLIKKLIDKNAFVMLPKDIAGIANYEELGVNDEKLFQNSDIVVCVGGDGTFLGVARKVCKYDTPILGVNVGNLGFLAEVKKSMIDQAVEALIFGGYEIENRMMLEGQVVSNSFKSNKYYALNDIVITRSTISRIINIKILLNDVLIDQFPADGIIISTPTGSTAYSLSAGGPIVEPDMNLIIITPICPHILHSRAMVVSDNKEITIVVEDKNKNTSILTVDGQESMKLDNGHKVKIRKSDHSLKMIKLSGMNFFDIIKEKLFNQRLLKI